MASKHEWTCKQCYVSFTSTRKDAHFCTPRCAAAYARFHGEYRARFHEEKANDKVENCQHCGNSFTFNDYADRSGKRQPQYCSNKCRQAAYRARKGANAGYTGHWDDARNDKRTREEKDKDTQRKNKKDKDTSQGTGAKKDTSQGTGAKKDTSQNWWENGDPYVIIGVTYLNTAKHAKAAYMKLVKLYHPDVCKDPNATVIMQAVNSAWDKIKNSSWAR